MRRRAFLLLSLALFAAAALPSAIAAGTATTTYVALGPQSEPYCFYKNLGEDGTGEYALWIDDPGYPASPWADIHAARFRAAADNIVTVPVCFSAAGKKLGAEATLTLRIETPRRNITRDYGICVRMIEDYDVAPAGQSPCDAAINYADVFSASLLEGMIPAGPGEEAETALHVSSGFMAVIELEKGPGIPMTLNATRLYMPGDTLVGIRMTAPSEPGDYNFTLRASVRGCDDVSCAREIRGVLRVSSAPQPLGFSVEISHETQDVMGMVPATYYLTVRNSGLTQQFSVSLEKDAGLTTAFEPVTVSIQKGSPKTFAMTVTPSTEKASLHWIKATVEDESGMSKVASATLTVHEASTGGEGGGGTGTGTRPTPPDISEWVESTHKTGTNATGGEKPPTQPSQPPQTLWIIAAVAAVCIAVAGFYIYKKSRVMRGDEPSYFEPFQEH